MHGDAARNQPNHLPEHPASCMCQGQGQGQTCRDSQPSLLQSSVFKKGSWSRTLPLLKLLFVCLFLILNFQILKNVNQEIVLINCRVSAVSQIEDEEYYILSCTGCSTILDPLCFFHFLRFWSTYRGTFDLFSTGLEICFMIATRILKIDLEIALIYEVKVGTRDLEIDILLFTMRQKIILVLGAATLTSII